MTTPTPDGPTPARRRWWPPRWPFGPRATLALAGAVVVVLVVAQILFPVPGIWPYPCDSGLRARGDSCVGVAGSGDFGDPGLVAVMGKIAAENSAVTGRSYGIGYLVPLEPPGAQTSLSAELRHELEGAALAQVRANRTAELGGEPKVRLLVGNAGPGNEYWPEVVGRFQELSQEESGLRAVAGLGNSLTTTKQTIAALTAPEPGRTPIATIGARLTADSLALAPSPPRPRVEGFFRVSPTNADEAAAAVDYIRSSRYQRPLLLSDRSTSDAYVTTLADAFRSAFGSTREATFNGSQDGLPNAFQGIVLNLCVAAPDVVYFAGRGDALVQFVEVLASRPCPGTPVPIVTGDDIAGLRERAATPGAVGLAGALRSNVSVVYTGLAHPDQWREPGADITYSGPALSHFKQFCEGLCFSPKFSQDDLQDGAAIMGHDAVVLAITGIRRAAFGLDGAPRPVTPSAVIQLIYQIQGTNGVIGASGALSMTDCGDVAGKRFPLLSTGADGRAKLIRSVLSGPPVPCH